MDEAERCDRVALMHEGRILECDAPRNLKKLLPGRLLSITARPLRSAASVLRARCSDVQIFGEDLHLLVSDPEREEQTIAESLTRKGIAVESIRRTEPSLEDVFVSRIAALSETASQPKGRTTGADTEGKN
jgi:ABC-2 type transport system ATP-binding protein